MKAIRYAVIMAGGSGERFWPLSRRQRPKQLLKLTSPQETLLEEAVNRIEPLVGLDRVIIATVPILQTPIRAASLVDPENVIAEPDKRNTMGCLIWAAAVLAARHPDAEEVSMAVLTADHKIGHAAGLRATVASALDVAEESQALVTIGIPPDRPETGYGYIERGDGHSGGSRVESFREKPDIESARQYLESGNFLWNSGMFFWTLEAFFRELLEVDPKAAAAAHRITTALRNKDMPAAEAAFRELPSLSIDYGLMEKASNVMVVPAQFPWDDVGSWDALERTMDVDGDGNVLEGIATAVDVKGSIVYNENPNQTVALVGVRDLIVIVTHDAVLVCPKQDAQRIKELIGKLPEDLL